MSCCNEPRHILAAFLAGKAFPTPAGPFSPHAPMVAQASGLFLEKPEQKPSLPARALQQARGKMGKNAPAAPVTTLVTQTPLNAPGHCTKTRRLQLFAHL